MAKLERFTKNARNVLKVAQTEAQRANHNYIGTEHLLLSLIVVRYCTGAKVLANLGVTEPLVRNSFLVHVGKGEREHFGIPTLAPRVKKVIELGVDVARCSNDKQIGTEHILMGLLDEGDGMGFHLLEQLIDISAIRERLAETLEGVPLPSGSPLIRFKMSKEYQEWQMAGETGWFGGNPRVIQEAAAQEERNRIARDLHDSIKQQLFNIKISAAAVQERWNADADGAKVALADVRESAQAAMVEMNALLMQLSPEPLEKTGLVEALREQCKALAFRTGAQVNTAFGELPPEALLPSDTQVALFRIAQEVLANVARHARADNVRLRLDSLWDEQVVLLEISDDGQGYEPKRRPKGMGLANINERAERQNGTVEIVSQPEQGTTITVKIPFLDNPTNN